MAPAEPDTHSLAEGGFIRQWRHRGSALRHLVPVLRIVWQNNAAFAIAGLLLRVVAATLPLGLLTVSRVIVDSVSALASRLSASCAHISGFGSRWKSYSP